MSKERRAIVTLVVAILVVCATAFFIFPLLRTHSTIAGSVSNAARKEKSIAVLPFENLSDKKDDAFFADGVQDDVLTKLARISELKVIATPASCTTVVVRMRARLGKRWAFYTCWMALCAATMARCTSMHVS
jgi:hypothetical protein